MLLPQEHTVMVRQTSKWGQIFLLSLGLQLHSRRCGFMLDEVVTVQGRLVPQNEVEVKSPVGN